MQTVPLYSFSQLFLNPYPFSTESQSCQCLQSQGFRATAPVTSLNSHNFNKHPIPAVSNDNGNNHSPFDLLPSHDPTLTFRLTEFVSWEASGFWLQTCLVPSHAQNSVQKMPAPVKLLKKYLQARPLHISWKIHSRKKKNPQGLCKKPLGWQISSPHTCIWFQSQGILQPGFCFCWFSSQVICLLLLHFGQLHTQLFSSQGLRSGLPVVFLIPFCPL